MGSGEGGCEVEAKKEVIFLKRGKLPDQPSEFVKKNSVPWVLLSKLKSTILFLAKNWSTDANILTNLNRLPVVLLRRQYSLNNGIQMVVRAIEAVGVIVHSLIILRTNFPHWAASALYKCEWP
jgi:hypothetical protein